MAATAAAMPASARKPQNVQKRTRMLLQKELITATTTTSPPRTRTGARCRRPRPGNLTSS